MLAEVGYKLCWPIVHLFMHCFDFYLTSQRLTDNIVLSPDDHTPRLELTVTLTYPAGYKLNT